MCLTKSCSMVNLTYTDWVLGTKKMVFFICREPKLDQSSGKLGNADLLEWELELHPDSQAPPNLSLCSDTFHSHSEVVVPYLCDIFIASVSKQKQGQGSPAYPFQCWFLSVQHQSLHCTVTCLQLALQCSNRSTHEHQLFAEQGLSQDQTLINGNFSVQFLLPAPRQPRFNLLQYLWPLSFPWCLH